MRQQLQDQMQLSACVFLLHLTCVQSYKILVYNPKFAVSHVKFMGV